MNTPRLYFIRKILLPFLLLSGIRAFSCGLDLNIPHNHFDGVNEHGNVSFWEKIGELDLGDGLKLPLTIGFNSSRQSSSPYLGEGWTLPLLESNVVQVDNRRFLMMQPDGMNTRFHRKDETETTLEGQGGWMAEVGEHTFTVWAKCGWKMVFTDGKITSITTSHDQVFTYDYVSGVVKEIDLNGLPLLTVLTGRTGLVTGLAFNNQQIAFKEATKPDLENLNGQEVVGHITPSLTQVTMPNGKIDNFKFAVDSKINPTLTISGINNRSFAWDPASSLILSDGNWLYNVIPGTEIFANAQIRRYHANAPNQVEYYFHSHPTG